MLQISKNVHNKYEGSENMNNIDLMRFWIESSDEDYNVMKVLYKNNKNNYCLFLDI